MAAARRLTQLTDAAIAAADIPDGPLVVALSGGADSAALLWVCVASQRTVRAVHVNHGLPGSPLMAGAAEQVAAVAGVDLETVAVTLGPGPSPENQARVVRYAALAAAVGPDETVLTAHTRDDQAETVIDHLLRGSGLDGLAGIPPRRPPFARPFLAVTRATTLELATLAGLPWRDDPANFDPQPLRNRVRRRLIPHLEETYNPQLRKTLATTAAVAGRDLDHLDRLAATLSITAGPSGTEAPAAVIATAVAPVAARMVRRFLDSAGLPMAPMIAVEAVLAVARGEKPRCQPGAGLTVRRRGAMLVAARDAASEPLDPVPLAVPGLTTFGRWDFVAMVTTEAPVAMPLGAAWMVADADEVGDLVVDAVARHAALDPVLAAAGVPAPERAAVPVLVGSDGPVWIPMVRRLPAGWSQPATDRYLVVQCNLDRTSHL